VPNTGLAHDRNDRNIINTVFAQAAPGVRTAHGNVELTKNNTEEDQLNIWLYLYSVTKLFHIQKRLVCLKLTVVLDVEK